MRESERFELTVDAIMRHRYGLVNALPGWLYAARYDHRFIDPELVARPIRRQPRARTIEKAEPADLAASAAAHLARLLALTDPRRLRAGLDELVMLDAPSLTRDDGVDPGALFADAAGLNIVIVGAGPIGLVLASALRLAFGPAASILVLEHRVAREHHKQPYVRRWLTAVDHDVFAGLVDLPVRELFARIGTRFIGATIDVLETLVLLSCRQLGVRFAFTSTPDLGFLADRPVDVVFDATGNRLDPPPDPRPEDALQIHARTGPELLGLSDEVLASYGVDVAIAPDEPGVEPATFGDLHFPLYRGRRLVQAFVKIIRIPARLCDELVALVAPRNQDNQLYVWRGAMRDEINECLVLVNLTRPEYAALCDAHAFPLSLADAAGSPALRSALDPRTVSVIDRLAQRTTEAERAQVELDAPFLWRPYCVDTAAAPRLHGRPVIRVGDSVYNGNVKLANGLGAHLRHVAHIQGMLWAHATAAHARRVARGMGRPR